MPEVLKCGYDWCRIVNPHSHQSDYPAKTSVTVAVGGNSLDVIVYQEFTEIRESDRTARVSDETPKPSLRWDEAPREGAKRALGDEFGAPGIGMAYTPMAEALTVAQSVRAAALESELESVTFRMPVGASEELSKILMDLLPAWYTLFCDKNDGYQNDRGTMFELGLAGQYSDMHRKFMKLKRAMWEGKPLVGEQLDEILMDMIGHCFLALVCHERERGDSDDNAPDFD